MENSDNQLRLAPTHEAAKMPGIEHFVVLALLLDRLEVEAMWLVIISVLYYFIRYAAFAIASDNEYWLTFAEAEEPKGMFYCVATHPDYDSEEEYENVSGEDNDKNCS